MNNIKKQFNQKFDKKRLSNTQEINIKNKIINGYKKKQKNKTIFLSLILIFNIILISTGITYGKEIKDYVTNMYIKVYTEKNNEGEDIQKLKIMSNLVTELNYDANLTEPKCASGINLFENTPINKECLPMYTYEELEKELDIKLLKNDLFKKNSFILTNMQKKDDKIASMTLTMGNTLVEDEDKESSASYVVYTINIRTKYNDNINNELNHGNYTEDTIPKYKIDNLNTVAYGIEYGRRRSIYFDYDNIMYSFSFNPNVASRDNPDDEVQKILDSFHY